MNTMPLFQELEARGIIKQTTDAALPGVLKNNRVTLYCGFDPTADTLHVGSLLPLMTLKRFQLAGHRVIAVVGGATGMIGDPSGKTQERSLLNPEQIKTNLQGIKEVISKFLDLNGSNPASVVNNADWFKDLKFIDFLRDVGKHFTINHMIAKESVRARLEDREHGISYTEFSYMLLQAYDFHFLNKTEGCRLQIGGSDQWGNITAGIELIRRIRATDMTDVFGLTHPLVTKADGTKFGKTEQGTLWIDPKKTSPYQFYQFFIQTLDADVGQFLRFFTLLPLQEIERLETASRQQPEKREAQYALAREMTQMIHGEQELARVEKASKALFGTEIRELDAKSLLSVLAGAPSTQKDKNSLSSGISLIDLLVETGLCSSKGAARKDITAGGIYLNNERSTDPATSISTTHLIAGHYVVLRKGKKTYHLVAFE
jgi:tyrosyl-tRNA synthetase